MVITFRFGASGPQSPFVFVQALPIDYEGFKNENPTDILQDRINNSLECYSVFAELENCSCLLLYP